MSFTADTLGVSMPLQNARGRPIGEKNEGRGGPGAIGESH